MSDSNVVQAVKPEEFRGMANAINRVEVAAKDLSQRSGLNNDALVTLLHASTHVAKGDIKTILYHLSTIGERYLTPEYRKLLREKK